MIFEYGAYIMPLSNFNAKQNSDNIIHECTLYIMHKNLSIWQEYQNDFIKIIYMWVKYEL